MLLTWVHHSWTPLWLTPLGLGALQAVTPIAEQLPIVGPFIVQRLNSVSALHPAGPLGDSIVGN
jgi:hypothetical protein